MATKRDVQQQGSDSSQPSAVIDVQTFTQANQHGKSVLSRFGEVVLRHLQVIEVLTLLAGSRNTSAEAVASGQEDGDATVGARLRKRRRTGSSTVEKDIISKRRSASRISNTPDVKATQTEVVHGPQPTTGSADGPTTARSSEAPGNQPHNDREATLEAPEVNGTQQLQTLQQGPTEGNDPTTETGEGQQPSAEEAEKLKNLISEIIDHGVEVDQQMAMQGQRAYDDMGSVDTDSWVPIEANVHLRVQSLPVLHNLVCLPASLKPNVLG